jgi:hypothetical protein
MRPGDRIVEAGGKRLASLKDYLEVLEDRFGQLPLSFLVVRGNQGYYINLP